MVAAAALARMSQLNLTWARRYDGCVERQQRLSVRVLGKQVSTSSLAMHTVLTLWCGDVLKPVSQ